MKQQSVKLIGSPLPPCTVFTFTFDIILDMSNTLPICAWKLMKINLICHHDDLWWSYSVMMRDAVVELIFISGRRGELSTQYIKHSLFGVITASECKWYHLHWTRNFVTKLSPSYHLIRQICRLRHIGLFCTCCDIGEDLSGHKTRERIKVTGVKFLQNSLVEDFKIPGLQCRMTIKCGWVCKARDTCSSTVI